jgi:DNA-directed RNA polymerase subunit RPC12/RpoP
MASRRAKHVSPAVALLVDQGTAWISRLRLKALLWMLAIAAAAWATVMLTSVAWVPVVGVAAVAAAVSINKLAHRLTLASPVCMHCGQDLAGRPVGEHGIACPSCGAIHMPRPNQAALPPAVLASADDHADEPRA